MTCTLSETELKVSADLLRAKLSEIEDELASPRFGWLSTDAPSAEVVEVLHGFTTRLPNDFAGSSRVAMLTPGLVDTAVFPIPLGTIWRPVSK